MDFDGQTRISTPESVQFQFELAGLGSRGLAFILDSLIRVGLLGALLLIYRLTGLRGLIDSGPGLIGVGLIIFLFWLQWFYFVFFEAFSRGQTPGKKALKIRVIKEGGYPIGFLESVIRNLLRIVDFLPALYLLGITLLFCTRRCQRLGDMAAGTLVVRDEECRFPAPPAPAGDSARPNPYDPLIARIELSTEEYELISRFLRRRYELEITSRERLLDRLIETVLTRHRIEIPRPLPGALEAREEFLERLLRGVSPNYS